MPYLQKILSDIAQALVSCTFYPLGYIISVSLVSQDRPLAEQFGRGLAYISQSGTKRECTETGDQHL